MTAVGQNVKRKDGIGKATGQTKYADDLTFPGMIYGKTIRSTIPAGRITKIKHDLGAGFTVADYNDIPGRNLVALIVDDQPCLVEREVRHVAEPIVLVAHEDRDKLIDADVTVEYETSTPVFDPTASPQILKELLIEKGNLEKGFAAADVIVEGTYRTGHQEHIYIETNGVIAVPEKNGVAVHGSIQCPFYVDKALRVMLGPDRHVRVIQTETGGGFGGKEEYPSMLACHAAILALKSGRAVKMIYDRVEDMLATTKRHPSYIKHRTGCKRDGRITAMDVDVIIDGGAYVTLSPVVLSRGGIHAAGPYRCANTRIRGRAMFTNTPPNGAFRGFGAPQTQFAMEVHMQRIAEVLKVDPVKLRERNALKSGDITATGQKLRDDCSAHQVLKEAIKRSGYKRRAKKYAGTNRGIGLSLFYHGSGFTGSGELRLGSKASVETTERGVRLLVSSTEIGQGTRTMHAQIVADAMGLPYEMVDVAPIDTSVVPDSGPTVASRTTMVVGKILERAAIELKDQLKGMKPAEHFRKHGRTRVEKIHEPPTWLKWDEERYRGDAYATFAWACNVAEIEIDRDTFEVRPLKITAVADIGKAIHPALARGQIEGGTGQGIGFATIEQVVMKNGAMANAQLTNYTIPTTLDTPDMDVVIIENPFPEGPFGAKGLGELPIDGPAPAIVNAIRSLGFDVRECPATPEIIQSASRSRVHAERLHDTLTYGASVSARL
jgi:CO/xanthine dehydrogenase Mo-binding subunit